MVEATLENIRETFRHLSDEADRRHRRLLADRHVEGIPRRRPLHRSDRPLHGGASHHHPAQRLPPHRPGEQLARPADRHGQARRAADLRHPPLSGKPGPLRREGASARRRRSCCSPTSGCRRSPASPATSSPGAPRVPSPWDSSAALFVVAETLIGELTRQLETDSARRIREMEGAALMLWQICSRSPAVCSPANLTQI